MKLLTFQAERFAWAPLSQTLDDAPPEAADASGAVTEAVVVFMQIEAGDQPPDARRRAFKHTLKHIKWLANKRDLQTIVLHSFTHLGGINAEADFAKALLDELQRRLEATGYAVRQTPFGWFSSWDLAVYGDSLAKVWKEISPPTPAPPEPGDAR